MPSTIISSAVNPQLARDLEAAAKRSEVTVSAFIRRAVERELERARAASGGVSNVEKSATEGN